jgi:hypothetical protein
MYGGVTGKTGDRLPMSLYRKVALGPEKPVPTGARVADSSSGDAFDDSALTLGLSAPPPHSQSPLQLMM